MTQEQKVNFLPTKRLLVEIITKDINIQDSILDLIDNSVDSYIRNKFKDTRAIKLSFPKNGLMIEDNCGGIDRTTLMHHVFRSGEKPADKLNTIGFFGIGLKRALFKLAEEFEFETYDGKEYSKINMNVLDWLNEGDENWELPLITKNGNLSRSGTFTRIKVIKFRDEIRNIITDTFLNDLKTKIGIYYTRFISSKKIKFIYETVTIESFDLKIIQSDEYSSASYVGKYQTIQLKISCWIQPRRAVRELVEEGKMGWNIFMNDRLIIIDDTSESTGWSGKKSELPKHHPIFNQFRGLVFLDSEDPSNLPLNTTKNNFNYENPAYHFVKTKMIETARPLITFLSKKYDQQSITTKEEEIELSVIEDSKKQTNIEEISIDEITHTQAFKTIRPLPTPKTVPIRFVKPKEDVAKIMKIYKLKNPKAVGEFIYEYFWSMEGLDK